MFRRQISEKEINSNEGEVPYLFTILIPKFFFTSLPGYSLIVMNVYLLSSASILAVTALVHSIAGERSIIGPLQKIDSLPTVKASVRFTKNTLRFAWHITSVLGLGIAAILLYYSVHPGLNSTDQVVLYILATTFALCFVVAMVGARKHPAWIAFLVASALTGLAAGGF